MFPRIIRRCIASAVLLCALALTSGCVTVTVSDSQSSRTEVEQVERARFQAWVRKDMAALERVIATDVLYCHSTGVCQNKAELIQFITGGQSVYKAMDVLQLTPKDYGDDTVVVNGKLDMKVETAGQLASFQAIYTDVYVKRDGRWQLVRWQSTRLP